MIRILSRLLIILFSTVSFSLFCQNPMQPLPFGQISEDELAMQSCALDPDAPAVILFDKCLITNRCEDYTGFFQEKTHHVRIKIFKKEGYERANLQIGHPEYQKIEGLKATCYNVENGKMIEVPLGKENIFDEKTASKWRLLKFNIPGVREGSIIEYQYTAVKQHNTQLPEEWVFQQNDIPTLWSEFEGSVPAFYDYSVVTQGSHPFKVSLFTDTILQSCISYLAHKMHFTQVNLPALKKEPLMPSINDYRSCVYFEIKATYDTKLYNSPEHGRLLTNGKKKEYYSTWPNLGKYLLDSEYADAIKSSKYTETIAQQSTEGKATPKEKATALYEYIATNYEQNDYDIYWLTNTTEELTKLHRGSATELNILLINMLNKVGVNAWPMLISTRENGYVHPVRISPDGFNRVIVAADLGEPTPTLINVAAYPNPLGLLEEEDLNRNGLLIKSEKEATWMPIQNTINTRTAVMGTFDLVTEGGLTGTVNYAESGYGAIRNRQYIASKDAAYALGQSFKTWAGEAAFKELKVENPENLQDPTLKMDFSMQTTAFLTASDNKLYLNPTMGLGLQENPFKNPDRTFDIALGTPYDETFILTYKIPAGYKIEEAPKSLKLVFGANSLGFEYRVDQTPEQLKVTIRSKVKVSYINLADYADLRKYYSDMLAKMEEQVVLTKM